MLKSVATAVWSSFIPLAVTLPGRDDRLRGGEPGDRDAERRARDVIQPDPIAEGDRRWLATVLAADPNLHVRFGLPPEVGAHCDELADAMLVEDLERISREDAAVDIEGQKSPG